MRPDNGHKNNGAKNMTFTLKDFAAGKKYKCKSILQSEFVLENRQAIYDDIAAQVKAQGGETELGVNGHTIQVKGGNQFWRLPTMPRERNGVLEFRSKDFVFTYDIGSGNKSYGDKPKAAFVRAYGFDLVMYNGDTIQYHLSPIE